MTLTSAPVLRPVLLGVVTHVRSWATALSSFVREKTRYQRSNPHVSARAFGFILGSSMEEVNFCESELPRSIGSSFLRSAERRQRRWRRQWFLFRQFRLYDSVTSELRSNCMFCMFRIVKTVAGAYVWLSLKLDKPVSDVYLVSKVMAKTGAARHCGV